jgi:DNA-binding NtrC family response regulator
MISAYALIHAVSRRQPGRPIATRALIVDDDVGIRASLRRILEKKVTDLEKPFAVTDVLSAVGVMLESDETA